ncbi:hypothetical protein [Methylobacterium nonmethylotrophicum]|uniref:Uncharacterized protein n=1 Tax=Methylobacterium nonmethylotrophicum TaxID=1141884 RepID=A0A4Z0NFN8_9HYPH|nr:hypothetical protein [Methylobacterium nonmethylotrophicum]TGD94878.1 hypothetical protein EU555_30350 [Methylobacterium nonmethylotrophicum]
MAFWLRAGLVIGAIYYLSPLRLGDAPGPDPALTAPVPMAADRSVGQALDARADDLRARVIEAGAAEAGRAVSAGWRAAMAEAGRPPSRDTLTAHDRQPAWRGAPERESR